MDFFTICANVGGSSAEILKGSSCIGNGEALFACSLVEDAKRPQDTFALVFSGSHVIMDGFTYYKLLAMLCDGAEIIALNPGVDPTKLQIGQILKMPRKSVIVLLKSFRKTRDFCKASQTSWRKVEGP